MRCLAKKCIDFVRQRFDETDYQTCFVTQTVSVWLVVVAALVLANLPFVVNQRLLGVIPLAVPKSLWMRLAELLVMYVFVGMLGVFLEQQAGQIAPQRWEFYAITVALFITLAFPGFVYRYLLKHRS